WRENTKNLSVAFIFGINKKIVHTILAHFKEFSQFPAVITLDIRIFKRDYYIVIYVNNTKAVILGSDNHWAVQVVTFQDVQILVLRVNHIALIIVFVPEMRLLNDSVKSPSHIGMETLLHKNERTFGKVGFLVLINPFSAHINPEIYSLTANGSIVTTSELSDFCIF